MHLGISLVFGVVFCGHREKPAIIFCSIECCGRKECRRERPEKIGNEGRVPMDPEQITLDEDFDDGSTDGGYGDYDFMQQEQDVLAVGAAPLGKERDQHLRKTLNL